MRFTSGQNSFHALPAISDSMPYPVLASAWFDVASLLTRHVFERKLFPGMAMYRAYAGISFPCRLRAVNESQKTFPTRLLNGRFGLRTLRGSSPQIGPSPASMV